MNQRWKLVPVATLWALLEACGASVSAQNDGGNNRDASTTTDGSAGACALPNGGTCPRGQTCPAGDGCNTCSCSASGSLGCTLIACMPPPGSCASGAECANGQECVFAPLSCGARGMCMALTPCAEPQTFCSCTGQTYSACRPNQPTLNFGACNGSTRRCDESNRCPNDQECVYPVGACGVQGVCSFITDCAAIADFCGCDGQTFRDCPNRPTRPAAAANACAGGGVADAGVNACGGSRLDASGRCVLADGSAAPVECCTGYQCDQSAAACESIPPECPAGYAVSVVGACWGPCVPRANCR